LSLKGRWGIGCNRRPKQNSQPDKTSQQARAEHLLSHQQAAHANQKNETQGLPDTHTTELDHRQPETPWTHAFWKVRMETLQEKRYNILIELHSIE
jgi:hypothetical protein